MTKQAGKASDRWSWVEASVWTKRMLETLDKGVKGGFWYSLIDKVYAVEVLQSAFARVKANDGSAGVDRQSIAMFERHAKEHIDDLSQRLYSGTYRVQDVRRVWIPKAGKGATRPLGIPTVKDRTVQTALRNVLEPIFERDFADCSYGFRPGRSCKDALRQVSKYLEQGKRYIVDADIKSFFDSLSHKRLMEQLGRKISDHRVLDLIEMYLKQGVVEETGTWTPAEGTPQGAVISPLLSNIYLDDFDHTMQRAGCALVRYADDWVIMCNSQKEATRALELARQWMSAAFLTLHPEKTRIVDLNEPKAYFDFLGYRFCIKNRYPTPKSVQKLRIKLKPITKRTSGNSMESIIAQVNPILKGWFEYFKHAYKTSFPGIDGWIRGRLRSILRRRRGGRGRSRGVDHQRWPNEYFAKLGLFSLVRERGVVLRSLTG